jgi:hypothetical protein
MRTVAEYRRHAEECEALAKTAKSPEEREMIAEMADTWRMLADQRASLSRTMGWWSLVRSTGLSPSQPAPVVMVGLVIVREFCGTRVRR